jgi:hypothetical protein
VWYFLLKRWYPPTKLCGIRTKTPWVKNYLMYVSVYVYIYFCVFIYCVAVWMRACKYMIVPLNTFLFCCLDVVFNKQIELYWILVLYVSSSRMLSNPKYSYLWCWWSIHHYFTETPFHLLLPLIKVIVYVSAF